MSSFSRYLRVFITSAAMLGRMVLIIILTLQSVAVMAEDCGFTHNDCDTDVMHSVLQTAELDNNVEQCDESNTESHVEDNCTECGNNCCSCCLTLMHPIALMQTVTASPKSFVFSFNSTSVEAPYFAFLRPPKALIV
jgi:hypothetical protein